MPVQIELDPALEELYADLESDGLSLTRAEYTESFGDRVVVLADRRISVRFVRDRGDWHIDLAVGHWPTDADFLYLPTWAGLLGWSDSAADKVIELEAEIAFVREHLAALRELTAEALVEEAVQRLTALEAARGRRTAKRLFG